MCAKFMFCSTHKRVDCNMNIFSILNIISFAYTLVEGLNCVSKLLFSNIVCKHLFIFRKELAEAQRTNKPCGKCHYYLLISKTFTEATKSKSKRREGRNQQKEELMFANAEEEFFYEVTYVILLIYNVYFFLHISKKDVSP